MPFDTVKHPYSGRASLFEVVERYNIPYKGHQHMEPSRVAINSRESTTRKPIDATLILQTLT